MTPFFPKHTHEWHFEEPTVVRRFSRSVWEMAILTGVALRLYRAMLASVLDPGVVWFVAFAGGLLLLCAMATLHLANYPLHRWVWRAPAFAALEAAGEALTSLGLIALGREPLGATRATWGDWPALALDTLWTRVLIVSAWALVLAGVIWVVRRTILREEVVEEDPVEETA